MAVYDILTTEQWNTIWFKGYAWQFFDENAAHALNRERYQGMFVVVGVRDVPKGIVYAYGVCCSMDVDIVQERIICNSVGKIVEIRPKNAR